LQNWSNTVYKVTISYVIKEYEADSHLVQTCIKLRSRKFN